MQVYIDRAKLSSHWLNHEMWTRSIISTGLARSLSKSSRHLTGISSENAALTASCSERKTFNILCRTSSFTTACSLTTSFLQHHYTVDPGRLSLGRNILTIWFPPTVVPNLKPGDIGVATRWNELDQIAECRRRWCVGHTTKIAGWMRKEKPEYQPSIMIPNFVSVAYRIWSCRSFPNLDLA